MARNEMPDQEMEDRLREHFAEEARDLRAPADLWERLEGDLGDQRPPRFALLRGGARAIGAKPWIPAAAAAVLVLAAGVGAWAIAGGPGDGGGDDDDAAYTAAPAAEAERAAPATQAAATEAAGDAPAEAYADDADADDGATESAAMAEVEAAEPGEPAEEAYDSSTESAATQSSASSPVGAASKGGGGPEMLGEEERQPADTTFADYGRQPFVETARGAVSTFSLDTDRTSYYLALTWAQSGYAVEPDSVRAEEWINAFDYGYELPEGADAFAVTSDVARHPLERDLHLVRIAFQAPRMPDDTPLNVTLVLDASGSMADGNRVAIAREAAEAIRRSLSERDRIAVVHFTTDVIREYTVEHRAPGDEDVAWSIARLAPHDSTNVQAGLDLGVQLADRARRERPDAYHYIILMSDGVANVDATNPFAILDSAADTDSRNPLRLITIGVGLNNYNDYLLEQLAQHGNGWYRYLDTAAQARDTFSRENWLALSTPFADQTRAQVTWDAALVKSWRIIGYENRITAAETFEENRKEFADIFSGAATTVFYEVELHPEGAAKAGGEPVRLGGVELRWVDPATGESRGQRAGVTGAAGAAFNVEDDALFRFGAVVALAADRYSALPAGDVRDGPSAAAIHEDLAVLREELRALRLSLSGRDSYRDFRFLLGELLESAEAAATSSGYSR